jgi:hypothetical protein
MVLGETLKQGPAKEVMKSKAIGEGGEGVEAEMG